MNKYSNAAKKAVSVFMVAGIVFMIGVITWASRYSVMVADDFWYARDTGRNIGLFDYVKKAWGYMIYEYKGYQGTYFSEFFCALFNPVNWYEFKSLRVIMFLNAILSFGSILFLATVALNRLFKAEIWVKLVILACVIFPITQYDVFPEIFFWYIGAGVYSVPMILVCVSLGTMILFNDKDVKKKKALFITTLILGFLGVGGSLAIAGTATYMVLILLIYYSIASGRIDRRNLAVFIVCFAGSLLSTLAPGNFRRQGLENSAGFDMIRSAGDTLKVTKDVFNWLFFNKNYELVILAVIICGVLVHDSILVNRKAWIICSVLGVLTPMVSIFPVVLGYNVPWIPNRCLYITIVSISLCWTDFAFMLGVLSGDLVKDKLKTPALAVLGVLFLLAFCFDEYNVREYKSLKMSMQLYRHTYQDYYEETRALIEDLPNHKGEDVVVDVATVPDLISNYYSFYLKDDPDNFINNSVAWKYELNSIVTSRNEGE